MDMKKIVMDRLLNHEKDAGAIASMSRECDLLDLDVELARREGRPEAEIEQLSQQRQYLLTRISLVTGRCEAVMDAVGQLDPDEQTALDVFFIHRQEHPGKVLAEMLHMDERGAYRLRARALADMARWMFGGCEV